MILSLIVSGIEKVVSPLGKLATLSEKESPTWRTDSTTCYLETMRTRPNQSCQRHGKILETVTLTPGSMAEARSRIASFLQRARLEVLSVAPADLWHMLARFRGLSYPSGPASRSLRQNAAYHRLRRFLRPQVASVLSGHRTRCTARCADSLCISRSWLCAQHCDGG